MAVGFSGSNTLTEQWNGSAWTIVPSPDLAGFTNNGLTGVSCPSTTSCITVGTASTPRVRPNGSELERDRLDAPDGPGHGSWQRPAVQRRFLHFVDGVHGSR